MKDEDVIIIDGKEYMKVRAESEDGNHIGDALLPKDVALQIQENLKKLDAKKRLAGVLDANK
jgi:hypothetical protein